MPKFCRSALARFRAGVAPIRIETGRFEHGYIPEHERICPLCHTEVESEKHVILVCPLYADLRQDLFLKAFNINNDFYEMSPDAKLCFLLSQKNTVNSQP